MSSKSKKGVDRTFDYPLYWHFITKKETAMLSTKRPTKLKAKMYQYQRDGKTVTSKVKPRNVPDSDIQLMQLVLIPLSNDDGKHTGFERKLIPA